MTVSDAQTQTARAQAALTVAHAAYAAAYRELAALAGDIDDARAKSVRTRMHDLESSFEGLGRLLRQLGAS